MHVDYNKVGRCSPFRQNTLLGMIFKSFLSSSNRDHQDQVDAKETVEKQDLRYRVHLRLCTSCVRDDGYNYLHFVIYVHYKLLIPNNNAMHGLCIMPLRRDRPG